MSQTQEQVTASLLGTEKPQTKTEEKKETSEVVETKEVASLEAETKKAEEHKNEPPEGSPRWNEIYFKAKEGDRRVKELTEDIKLMRKHNQEMMEIVKQSSSKKEETEETPAIAIKSQMAALKQKRREAAKDMDMEKVYELEDQIDELREKLNHAPDVKRVVKDAVEDTMFETAINDFVEETEWYNPDSDKYDKRMAAYAREVDRELITNGYKGSIKRRLAEVKKLVEEEFSYGKQTSKIPPKTPTVEGVATLPPTKEKTEDISPDERRVAHLFYPDEPDPVKKYIEAKQLKKGLGK